MRAAPVLVFRIIQIAWPREISYYFLADDYQVFKVSILKY